MSESTERRHGFIRNAITRFASAKSAQGVSIIIALCSMASKPLGYVRTIMIAWLFGTSAGMDSYNLANGIIMLAAGTVGTAMESAVLPETRRLLEQEGIDTARCVLALAWWCTLAFVAVWVAMVAIGPGVLIRFFAGGFDPERIRLGAKMLRWLVPFAAVTALRPLMDAWAMVTQRYTLGSLTMMPFNLIAIPLLLVTIPLFGVFSVPFSLSSGFICTTIFFFIALGGVPIRVRRDAIPWDSLKKIAHNMIFVTLSFAAGSLYTIVDRYFASQLAVGAVTSISYALQVFTIVQGGVMAPMLVFLTKSSEIAARGDGTAAADYAKNGIVVGFTYCLPMACFLAALAKPIVSVLFGWGNFGAESVRMTSICLAAYSFIIPISIVATMTYRYAQAVQRLMFLTLISYPLIALNGLLDFILMKFWGIGGLAFATTICSAAGMLLGFFVMFDDVRALMARLKIFKQLAVAAAFSAPLWLLWRFNSVVPLLAAAPMILAYICASEKLGLFDDMPEHWRPRAFVKLNLARAASLFKKD